MKVFKWFLAGLLMSGEAIAAKPTPLVADVQFPPSPMPQVQPYTMGLNLSLAHSTGFCAPRDNDVFYQAGNTPADMGVFANVQHILQGGRTGLYMSAFTLKNLVVTGDAYGDPYSVSAGQAVTTTWANTGGGIGEEFYDTYGTPAIPAANHNDGGGLNAVNGPAISASIGFAPKIMMMNVNANGDAGDSMTTAETALAAQAFVSVRAAYPSVRYVFPYNGPSSIYATQGNWSTNSYWANARSMILAAGGFGLDTPVGLLQGSLAQPARMQAMIDQLKWANSNGLVSIFLVTPYSATAPAGVTPQFAVDPNFFTNAKLVIEALRNADALPSAWVVGNYSGWQTINGQVVTANRGGADTDAATPSSAFVTRWFAENAPTSRFVPIPAGSTSAGPVLCGPPISNGLPAARVSIGAAGLGLSSMAWEDSNNVNITGGVANFTTLTTSGTGIALDLTNSNPAAGEAAIRMPFAPVSNIYWPSLSGIKDANLVFNSSNDTITWSLAGNTAFTLSGSNLEVPNLSVDSLLTAGGNVLAGLGQSFFTRNPSANGGNAAGYVSPDTEGGLSFGTLQPGTAPSYGSAPATVATLPACNGTATVGHFSAVKDASVADTAANIGTTAVGGGANYAVVNCNGVNWTIH